MILCTHRYINIYTIESLRKRNKKKKRGKSDELFAMSDDNDVFESSILITGPIQVNLSFELQTVTVLHMMIISIISFDYKSL